MASTQSLPLALIDPRLSTILGDKSTSPKLFLVGGRPSRSSLHPTHPPVGNVLNETWRYAETLETLKLLLEHKPRKNQSRGAAVGFIHNRQRKALEERWE